MARSEADRSDDPTAKAGRRGRRAALALYWAFLAYIAVVGFASVIPQTFWPTPTPNASAPDGSCSDGIETLARALRTHASLTVEGTAPPLNDFLRQWDDRYLLLAERCDNEPRYRRLGALRYRLETTLRTFEREDGRLLAEFERGSRDTHDD